MRDIILVGSGNVATHLAGALSDRIQLIISRNPEHAAELANNIGAEASSNFEKIAAYKAPIVLISVADNAINDVVTAIGRLEYSPLVAHTSGSVPMELLTEISNRVGVLYPLQTFSKNTPVNMGAVPFFTEASHNQDYDILDGLAKSISGIVHHADAKLRRKLHIAGVFSSNFIVALIEVAEKVLLEAGYPLETVHPLVGATVDKIFRTGPYNAMTGPAVRGDREVMKLQSSGLAGMEREVYDLLSRYIVESHHVELK